MEIEVTTASVFEALGHPRAEAAVFAMRVHLADEIRTFVRRKRMTQAAAADFFGVTQPRISNILNDHLDDFTIDYLVKMVSRTGRTPRISFARRKSAPSQHRVNA
jgi:predicted XRE-type DNA-binding protein